MIILSSTRSIHAPKRDLEPMDIITGFFGLIEDLTWGWALIPILVVFGVFITVMSGFGPGRILHPDVPCPRRPRNQTADPNAISAREALLISVGGRVGGGNIAGVAVAITLGGPGAVFWMWAIALVGMATSLVESTLAQLYKRSNGDGTISGRARRLHHLRARRRNTGGWRSSMRVCLMLAFAFGFNAFQGNTLRRCRQRQLGIDRMWSGIALAIITGFIVYGGIRRIAKVADVIIPIIGIQLYRTWRCW